MDIRILTLENVACAVELAKNVYDQAIRHKQTDMTSNRFFDEYMTEQNIRAQIENGTLKLWGVIENEQLAAVSGMTNQGQITMLYVGAQYLGKKYAANLLEQMKYYAAHTYGLEYVSVNAIPVWSAKYFQKRGFRMIDSQIDNTKSYVPLIAKSNKYEIFKTRRLSGYAWLAIIAVFICLVIVSSLIGVLYFLR